MAVETNARIEFSVDSVEEWEKVNPKLHQGEPVFAKKPSGKYILKVGAPGGSTYKNAVTVWDQDDAETKMTNTQTAATQALASKNAASASASAAKASENAAAGSKSAAATSAANAKTSETNAAASKNAAANSASTASTKATAAGNSASAAATSEKNAASSASAAATSESNAQKSASAASTSADNAKSSETKASASASAAKTSETSAAASKSAAATSEANAKTSETNAAASANVAKAWSMSDSSPDGVSGNKSSKTWAEAAKASANNAAASASASATSANNSSASATAAAKSAADAKAYTEATRGQTPSGGNSARVWAEFALEKAQAATASASAASTSATNAKTSETSAATSAKAAKQSEENAKTWDPTKYAKYNEIFPLTGTGMKGIGTYNIKDLNDIKCLSYPSWFCPTKKEAVETANCPARNAFFLFNLRSEKSSDSEILPNLTSKWYYMVQIIINVDGNMWMRACANNATATFNFTEWQKVTNTEDLSSYYTKTEVDAKIPTKTSQLTNDSGFASTEMVDAEVQKWKKAYNNLRKRSYPTAFDEDELTVLMSKSLTSGTITLSQPYTDFDGLLFLVANENGHRWQRIYISTATLQEQIKDCQNDAANYYSVCLFNGAYHWWIFVDDKHKFSETSFPEDTNNCWIYKIYGVKFKEIT